MLPASILLYLDRVGQRGKIRCPRSLITCYWGGSKESKIPANMYNSDLHKLANCGTWHMKVHSSHQVAEKRSVSVHDDGGPVHQAWQRGCRNWVVIPELP